MTILANGEMYPVSMPWQPIKKLFSVAVLTEIKRKRPLLTQKYVSFLNADPTQKLRKMREYSM